MLAELLNVPSTDHEWSTWSWHHRLSHDAIREAVKAQKGLTLIDYNIDPIPSGAIVDWLDRNQQMHVDMDGAVGAQSQDLSDVNPEDRNQLAAWIWLHAQDHITVEARLGIGS